MWVFLCMGVWGHMRTQFDKIAWSDFEQLQLARRARAWIARVISPGAPYIKKPAPCRFFYVCVIKLFKMAWIARLIFPARYIQLPAGV